MNLLLLNLVGLAQEFLLELAIHVAVQYYVAPPGTFPAASPAVLPAGLLVILPILQHYILPNATVDPVGYLSLLNVLFSIAAFHVLRRCGPFFPIVTQKFSSGKRGADFDGQTAKAQWFARMDVQFRADGRLHDLVVAACPDEIVEVSSGFYALLTIYVKILPKYSHDQRQHVAEMMGSEC